MTTNRDRIIGNLSNYDMDFDEDDINGSEGNVEENDWFKEIYFSPCIRYTLQRAGHRWRSCRILWQFNGKPILDCI